jgi:hypothetical protein
MHNQIIGTLTTLKTPPTKLKATRTTPNLNPNFPVQEIREEDRFLPTSVKHLYSPSGPSSLFQDELFLYLYSYWWQKEAAGNPYACDLKPGPHL